MFSCYSFCFLLALSSVSGLGLPRKFHDKFDPIKKRMNEMLNGKKGNEMFLDINELEYPGANETLRRVYREQWQEYYECLRKRFDEMGATKTIFPIVLLALEGTSVILKCNLCVSPLEMHTSDSIEWFFNDTRNSSIANIPVEVSERIFITPDERNLNLYNIQMNDAGIYWCQLEDIVSSPYFLSVANDEMEKTRSVRPKTAPRAENYPLPPEDLEEYGLTVYSEWTRWSPCSTCDKVGIKIRYGYCTISLIENYAYKLNTRENKPLSRLQEQKRAKKSWPRRRRHDAEKTVEEESFLAANKLTPDAMENIDADENTEAKNVNSKSPDELKSFARDILSIFRNGLPCRSPYTPKDLQNIRKIEERRTEIMTAFCKVECPRNLIFEIRDRHGKVLESANNSAGIYSLVQGIPEPRPSIQRITIYRRHGKKIEMQCPGNLYTEVPVTWKIGTKVLEPSTVSKMTNERITIDLRKRILIKKLRFSDSGIYSCWQRDELAGTIRLEVTNDVELKIDHRVFMIGAIAIVATMLFIFWRAFTGRKRFTMH